MSRPRKAPRVPVQRDRINEPGARTHTDGSVIIQFAKRGAQLDSIAVAIDEFLALYDIAENYPADSHRLRGYCEQLRIIADELTASGH